MALWPSPACTYGKVQLNYYRLIRTLETMVGWRSCYDIANGAVGLGFHCRTG